MSSRADIANGKRNPNKEIVIETLKEPAMIALPNLRKVCAIFLFFAGSFAVGYGAGFGIGYAIKTCD